MQNPCGTIVREIEISNIWTALVHNSKSPFPILEDEQEMLTRDIEHKLITGWTPREIISYLGYTEYFNTQDSEDFCLKKMSEIEKKMKVRGY